MCERQSKRSEIHAILLMLSRRVLNSDLSLRVIIWVLQPQLVFCLPGKVYSQASVNDNFARYVISRGREKVIAVSFAKLLPAARHP